MTVETLKKQTQYDLVLKIAIRQMLLAKRFVANDHFLNKWKKGLRNIVVKF